MRSYLIYLLLLAIVIPPITVLAQTCSDPDYGPGPIWEHREIQYIEDETWIGHVECNNTLIINTSLVIRDCIVTMEGGYIQVEEGGSLTLINSTIKASCEDMVYYIDIRGEALIRNSTIHNALDISNGYFGLYVRNGPFVMESSDLSRSGMIWFKESNSTITDTIFEGSYHESGSHVISGCEVITMGVSITDGGTLIVNDTGFTSNVTFSSGAAAISATDGVDIVIEDVRIVGTYNAGMFTSFCNVEIRGADIELPGGIYGLKFDNCSMSPLSKIYVEGCDIGVSFIGCSGDLVLSESHIDNAYYGVILYGPSPLTIDDIVVNRTTKGIVSYGPVLINNTRFITNGVCISITDDKLLQVNNTRFEAFEFWGIMVQTWEDGITYYDHNTYIGTGDAFGDIAFYGIVDIRVVGPEGITVKGAEIWIRSPFGTSEKMGQGDLEIIWGYLDGGALVDDLDYTANSSWAPAEGSTDFRMEEGLSVEVFLPLVDVWVRYVAVEGEKALVNLTVSGTDTRAVSLWIYIDGAFSHALTTDLTVGTDVQLEIDLSNASTGEHTVSVEAHSSDEWNGNSGILQENNKMTESFEVKMTESFEEREDTGDELLLIYLLVIGAILLFIVPILLRRKE